MPTEDVEFVLMHSEDVGFVLPINSVARPKDWDVQIGRGFDVRYRRSPTPITRRKSREEQRGGRAV
jgi:hypothetical protein